MISVGLPAYKALFLKEAINSVLNQTYKNFELIIVNDASPENIDEIVNFFDDSRIRYYKNDTNFGKISIVRNWNRCLELSKGEYFVLFSDDDVYEPGFLEEMVLLAKKYKDKDLFHCRVRQIDKYGKTLDYSATCPEFEDIIDFIWHRIKGYRLQYVTDFFCRTNAIKIIGGFVDMPLAWGSDDLTWYLLAKEKGVVYSPKVLCNWRYSDINISSIGDITKRIEALNTYYSFLQTFMQDIISIREEDYLSKDIIRSIPIRKNKSIENLTRTNMKNISFFQLLIYKKKYNISFYMILKILLQRI